MMTASGNQYDFYARLLSALQGLQVGGRELVPRIEKCAVNINGKQLDAWIHCASFYTCFGRQLPVIATSH